VIGFNPDTLTLTLRRQWGFITIYRQRITITQVKDVDEGLALLDTLRDAINAAWEHSHELTPVTQSKRPPRPQGLFLYHLPFPNTEALTIAEIVRKAGVDEEVIPEILDIVNLLEKYDAIELLK